MLLYGLGNASQGMIARLLGVSHVAVYRWVRAAGEAAPAPSAEASGGIVQIDEMWHFVNGKKTRFGSGGPTTLWHGEPWPGSWVGVMMRSSSAMDGAESSAGPIRHTYEDGRAPGPGRPQPCGGPWLTRR